MELQTKLGPLLVNEEDIIHFPVGLLGLSEYHRYVVVEREGSVFDFLLSIDEPALAFVIIMPELVAGDYSVVLNSESIELLKLTEPEDGRVYAIVTVPDNPAEMTVNLQAPLVINTKEKLGAQIIIGEGPYHTRHNVLAEMQKSAFLQRKQDSEEQKGKSAEEIGRTV